LAHRARKLFAQAQKQGKLAVGFLGRLRVLSVG